MRDTTHLLDELTHLLQRHADAPVTRSVLPGLVLSKYTRPTEALMVMAEPALALVVQGAKHVTLGDRTYRYAPGQYLIYLVDLPLTSRVVEASPDRPLLGLGLALKPESIAALMLDGGAPPRRDANQRGIAVSELDSDLLDPVTRLVRLLDRPADIPVLAPAIEREILWRLMNGDQGGMVRRLGLAGSRTMQVTRAIKWIRSHYAETIRIETLAEVAGMSMTSLHRHFLATTAMSPIQYQKQVRLQMARALLLSAPRGVAQVGLEVGYDSPSQFSREYRRLFGRPPSEDGALLRASRAA
jgi:AraC-like DNA-binding protein